MARLKLQRKGPARRRSIEGQKQVEQWLSFPHSWPWCDQCGKPVDRWTTDMKISQNEFSCRVECHGQTELVIFTPSQLRRIYFCSGGVRCFKVKQATIFSKRKMDL